ncbi:MAG TPA: PadR family transcriptional regulator [Longimicrobiales bacterium]|jgi:DNA-binding PadR family transcriptional regulator
MGEPVTLGDLQHLVMLAVARLGEDAYGGAAQEELRRVAGRDVSVSTVYVTLVRLEEQGLVTSEQAAPGGGGVGRPRRYFSITPEGWEALRASRSELDQMWRGVEPA